MTVSKRIRKRAYSTVRSALQSGKITRPENCEVCGAPERKAKDGRSLLQAHHPNGYDDALDIVWTCVDCHAKETPQPCGVENHLSKFTDAEIAIMRDLSLTPREASKIVGSSRSYVNQVRRGEYRARAEQKGGA